MIDSNRIAEIAEAYRNRLVIEANRERLVRDLKQQRQEHAIFLMLVAELMAAAGAVIVLRG